MYLAIQPNLMERTVFEAVRKDASLRPQYERQFSDCYEHREGYSRDQAFAEMHERWFNELGLRALLAGLVNEFPHFREQVSRLMVAQAPGPMAQTAELFGAPGQYSVVMAIAPAALLDLSTFEYWARHEFLHVDDMLNPAFAFDAMRRPNGTTLAAKNLMQDRYAVLWAIAIDARLAQRGLAPADIREKRWAELQRAFAHRDKIIAEGVFKESWEQWGCAPPSHQELLERAQEGLSGSKGDEANHLNERRADLPGAPCPLCGFPTFDWDALSNDESAVGAVRADFPSWTPVVGICGRCAEVYRAASGVVGSVQASA